MWINFGFVYIEILDQERQKVVVKLLNLLSHKASKSVIVEYETINKVSLVYSPVVCFSSQFSISLNIIDTVSLISILGSWHHRQNSITLSWLSYHLLNLCQLRSLHDTSLDYDRFDEEHIDNSSSISILSRSSLPSL